MHTQQVVVGIRVQRELHLEARKKLLEAGISLQSYLGPVVVRALSAAASGNALTDAEPTTELEAVPAGSGRVAQ